MKQAEKTQSPIKREPPKKWFLFSALLILFISAIVIAIIFNTSKEPSANNNHTANNQLYSDDWAMYNYGQSIEGNPPGIEGVDINIIPAWEIAHNGEPVIVAVVDTGTDYSCDILKDRILINADNPLDGVSSDFNRYFNDTYGWNFYDDNNIIYEEPLYDYHGTYISTTIARITTKNISILPVKFMKSTSGSVEDAISAIKYAISRGARIINCSWNFNEPSNELYAVMKDNADILFVCSAGNSNIDLDKDSLYPCSFDLDNVINVMAIDNQGKIYRASGYGKNTVHIAAPGVNVKVTLPENEESFIDGTSVAAAFVSGASALMLSQNNQLSPGEIKQIIISTARKHPSLSSLCAAEGYLDIKACLLASSY